MTKRDKKNGKRLVWYVMVVVLLFGLIQRVEYQEVSVKAAGNQTVKKALKAYGAVVENILSDTEYGYPVFQLIYLDKDSIPELFIRYGMSSYDDHECGYALYTYTGGKATTIEVTEEFRNHSGASFFSAQYIPKTGKILHYGDTNYGGGCHVYKITKDKVKVLGVGAWEYTSQKRTSIRYQWNKKTVRKKRYNQLLNKQFPRKMGIDFVNVKCMKGSKMLSYLKKRI